MNTPCLICCTILSYRRPWIISRIVNNILHLVLRCYTLCNCHLCRHNYHIHGICLWCTICLASSGSVCQLIIQGFARSGQYILIQRSCCFTVKFRKLITISCLIRSIPRIWAFESAIFCIDNLNIVTRMVPSSNSRCLPYSFSRCIR